MDSYKVIIAGSRGFKDYKLLKTVCNKYIPKDEEIEIVSGTAYGADKLGERYANDKDYEISKFPPKWKEEGRSAGYLRNKRMAEYSDMVIVFWDGESKGTGHMINIAREKRMKLIVVNYKN